MEYTIPISRGRTATVDIIYKRSVYIVYRSLEARCVRYTVANEHGLAIGFCTSKRKAARAVGKLIDCFGDSINFSEAIGMTHTKAASLRQFYIDNQDIISWLGR